MYSAAKEGSCLVTVELATDYGSGEDISLLKFSLGSASSELIPRWWWRTKRQLAIVSKE